MSQLRSELAVHPVHGIPPAGSRYAFGRIHRDRASLTGYRMELGKRTRAAALAMRGIRGAERRFVVMSRPRSGSTLLVDLLRQVEDLRCDGEMLHFAVHQPSRLLSALARTCVQSAYGCKVLSYQMFEVQKMRDPLAFLRALEADGFRFIHLRRQTFAQCLSLSKAQETGVYVSWVDGPARKRTPPEEVALDPDAFRRQVEWNAAMLDYEDRLMSAVPHEIIQYETDLTTPAAQQATVDRICAMIGHPTGPVAARTAKTGDKRRPITRITNSDALRAVVDDLGIA